MIRVYLRANNPHGKWSMKDEDWYLLERNGWTIRWVKDWDLDFERVYRKEGRYIGALAVEAHKDYDLPTERQAEAVARIAFEELTGYDADHPGCRCCGQRYYFSTEILYA